MIGAKLDQSKLKKSGFYKKRILVFQENCKLFTILVGAFTLIMLILNIVNACTGGVGFGWAIFLNVIWLACCGGFIAYVLLGARQKLKAFWKIDEIAFGDFESEYALCEIVEATEALTKGNVVRLYETVDCYCLVSDGVQEKRNGFWTKYNFKEDFGRLYLDKAVFRRTEQDGIIVLEAESENISLRRK